MEEELIIVEEYCSQYNVDITFVASLEEYGLITVTVVETKRYIPLKEVQAIERYVHMHYELEINMPGLEAISHLLDKVEHLQDELATLKERLRLYSNS